MSKFIPIHYDGHPQYEHFRLRVLTDLQRSKVPGSTSEPLPFLATVEAIYATPAHLFFVFNTGKCFFTIDGVSHSTQRHSEQQAQELLKEVLKVSSPLNSSTGGANIHGSLVFKHDKNISDLHVINTGSSKFLVVLDDEGALFTWYWDHNEIRWVFISTIKYTDSTNTHRVVYAAVRPDRLRPKSSSCNAFIIWAESKLNSEADNTNAAQMSILRRDFSITLQSSSAQDGSSAETSNLKKSSSSIQLTSSSKWVASLAQNTLRLGDIDIGQEENASAKVKYWTTSTGLFLIMQRSVLFVSALKSPLLRYELPESEPSIKASTVHPITEEILLLMDNSELRCLSTSIENHTISCATVSRLASLDPSKCMHIQAQAHTLIVFSENEVEIYDIRTATKLESLYLPHSVKFQGSPSDCIWRRAQVGDWLSCGVYSAEGVWHLKTTSLADWLNKIAEKAVNDLKNGMDTKALEGLLTTTREWNFTRHKLTYLLDIIEKLLSAEANASELSSEEAETFDDIFNKVMFHLVPHIQSPAYLLALLHNLQWEQTSENAGNTQNFVRSIRASSSALVATRELLRNFLEVMDSSSQSGKNIGAQYLQQPTNKRRLKRTGIISSDPEILVQNEWSEISSLSTSTDNFGADDELFSEPEDAPLIIPPVEPSMHAEQSLQYYTPLNASLLPLIKDYMDIVQQQCTSVGNSGNGLLHQGSVDIQPPGLSSQLITAASKTSSDASSPTIYDVHARAQRISLDFPRSLHMDNLQPIIYAHPELALEKLERIVGYERSMLEKLKPASSVLVYPLTVFTIPIKLNNIIYKDDIRDEFVKQSSATEYEATHTVEGVSDIPLESENNLTPTPLLFELLCQLYYEHRPDLLPLFVDMVEITYKNFEPSKKAPAKQTRIVLPGGIQVGNNPRLSDVERSFYARAVEALPPLDIYGNTDNISFTQLSTIVTLLDRDQKYSQALQILLGLKKFRLALDYIRSKLALKHRESLHTELTQTLMCHCINNERDYCSEGVFDEAWSLLPIDKLSPLQLTDIISQCIQENRDGQEHIESGALYSRLTQEIAKRVGSC